MNSKPSKADNMKTLTVKDITHGRTKKLNTKTTYQAKSGKWIAEVDEKEFYHECFNLCEGIKDCACEDLHVEADQDDDGKEYSILTE